MPVNPLASLRALPQRVPFFYGWVIVGCAICAAFARQGAAVATLSVFVEPMCRDFGWSRTALSGAVSLGGVLAAFISPVVGAIVDRRGAGVVLALGALVVGGAALALSQTTSLLWFYVAFSIGRMTFASPFDIGISGSIASWFRRYRAQAMSYVNVGASVGLAAMPMIAHIAMTDGGWPAGWIALGISVIAIGALPAALLMHRRPEDVGLMPDGAVVLEGAVGADGGLSEVPPEPQFSRGEALRTPALWLLVAYTAFIFPVQAGISLHQAPNIIQQGLSATVAATVVTTFSLAATVAGLGFGFAARRIPVRFLLAGTAALMTFSAVAMVDIGSATQAYAAGILFGGGIGGLLTLLPVAWADYFGRDHFGAIRGVTLPVQVVAQAAGPLIAGALYDLSGSYQLSLNLFCGLGCVAVVLALLARPPARAA